MKQKSISFWLITTLSIALVISIAYRYADSQEIDAETKATESDWAKPILMKTDAESERYGDHKRRHWTAEETRFYKERYAKIRSLLPATPQAAPSLASPPPVENDGFFNLANNTFSGKWTSRGPANMPGAFQFSEVDEGTDTVYSVSCGHYGGVQFIWKGTLAGDDWKMVNPKHPSRFEDLMIVPNGVHRRIIAAEERGGIMYSDNSGATWNYSTGIEYGVKSTIVNRQDDHTIYTTDGSSVYVSYDLGTSFTLFQTLSSATHARLYTPRWDIQPNASDVYFAQDGSFYKLNSAATSFEQISTIASGKEIGLGGDSRRLWMTQDSKNWYHSTNGGLSWNAQATESWWYSGVSPGMSQGQYPGIHPEDPDIIIGGYAFPLTSRDAGTTTNSDAKNWWGHYQNSVGNDEKVRIHFHPDNQASQFFYDASGTLISLRSSDGGIFKSYNEWTKTEFPTLVSIESIFTNITLFNAPTQEAYRGGFISGKNNSDDMTSCTQDQGWQNTRASSYGTDLLSWDQVGGGDGPNCISGDGLIGWSYNYQGTGSFKRINLYDGSGTYKGLSGSATGQYDLGFAADRAYFTPGVGDWSDGDRIWVMSNTLRKVEYNGSTITGIEHDLAASPYFVQGVAQSRENPDIVFAMEDGYVFKSTNRGSSWDEVASQSTTGIEGTWGIERGNFGMGWAVDNQTIIFATESGSNVRTVFSTDGGTVWSNVTGSGINEFPPASVNGMTANEAGTLIFASTSAGPYVFVVAEEQWHPLALEGSVPIFWGQVAQAVKDGNTEIIRFSTWGQGIWDLELGEVTPTLTLLSPLTDTLLTPEDSITLTWDSNQAENVLILLKQNGTVTDTLKVLPTEEGAFTISIPETVTISESFSIIIQHTLTGIFDESATITIIPDDENIALNKSVTVSSTNSSDNSTFITDNNSESYWRSKTTDSEHWAAVDLENAYHIGIVVVEWGALTPTDYFIEMLDDSEEWIELNHTTDSDGAVDVITLNTGFTSSLRIRSTNTGSANAISINEIRVYANPNPVIIISSSSEEASSSEAVESSSSEEVSESSEEVSVSSSVVYESSVEQRSDSSEDDTSPLGTIAAQNGTLYSVINNTGAEQLTITAPQSSETYTLYTLHGERINSGTLINGAVKLPKNTPKTILFIYFK